MKQQISPRQVFYSAGWLIMLAVFITELLSGDWVRLITITVMWAVYTWVVRDTLRDNLFAWLLGRRRDTSS